MRYENFTTGFNKPAIFSAQTYGTKTTVELDHSDLDLNEVMDVFKTLIVGMGYNSDSFKQWVLEMAEEYKEEENDKWDDVDNEFENLRHSTDNKPHWDWDDVEGPQDYTEEDEKRMDIIGQNGNEGTHYYKDSDGFENYQFDKPNEVLIDAKKQYDEQMKKEKKKTTKKKAVKKTNSAAEAARVLGLVDTGNTCSRLKVVLIPTLCKPRIGVKVVDPSGAMPTA